ncbi:MAG: pyridoxine 5'-phosphate synthase [Chitinophagales bacterium]|nr:pyridoxine 5'-phosphate synthase [Chitinophagales bacterium]MDW8273765.1 pyridoxine 5'-phosphate synthase [Chitinophagales bacterium]
MTRLSVNINKVALLRNSRGGNVPDVLQFAKDCEKFGAQGITVHPRPDERHITRKDVYILKEHVATELNIEGYPSDNFLAMIEEVKPHQCTLVPDRPEQLTSDHGWDCVQHKNFLTNIIKRLHNCGVRVSLFIDPDIHQITAAKETGTDRIEFYTGPYAKQYPLDKKSAIEPYQIAAEICRELNLGMNAGHDLNLHNLKYLIENIPDILEVSIGHALISDCLYLGLENTIQLYLRQLN